MANKILLYTMQQHRDWFYDDFVIETAYGSPDSCIWNGNRPSVGRIQRPTEIAGIFGMYRDFGIIYRLTFTNFLLNQWHLYDTYGNTIARIGNGFGGYVMVSLPMMALYFRNNYPNLKVCWSTTTEFPEGIKTVNTLSERELVVLPYEYNNKWELLEQLEHPENVEVLINEKCIDNCPRRREHWARNNAINLMMFDGDSPCFFGNAVDRTNVTHLVPRNKLGEYTARGINHFKIEGRLNNYSVRMAYLDYFVLPERQQEYMAFFDECSRTNFGLGWPVPQQ